MHIGGYDMLLNNIELDIKTKCIEENMTQTKVAETIGTSKSYFSRIVNGQDKIVNNMFIKAIEALGYGVRITYEKRNE
jgi:hypothetical protein